LELDYNEIFKDIKMGIALPLTSKITNSLFWDHFTMMTKPSQWAYLKPALEVGDYAQNIAIVRNALVEQAINADCTHILMMDTDQTPERDSILKLARHKLPIVHAKVHRRYPPFDPIFFRGELHKYNLIPDEEWSKGGLMEVDATGAGMVLYDVNVFFDVEYPWYEVIMGGKDKDGKSRSAVGEDIFFCHKLKQAGYKIYVDCDIKIGHLSTVAIDDQYYYLFKLLKKLEEERSLKQQEVIIDGS
jgi:hypothetical protein